MRKLPRVARVGRSVEVTKSESASEDAVKLILYIIEDMEAGIARPIRLVAKSIGISNVALLRVVNSLLELDLLKSKVVASKDEGSVEHISLNLPRLRKVLDMALASNSGINPYEQG